MFQGDGQIELCEESRPQGFHNYTAKALNMTNDRHSYGAQSAYTHRHTHTRARTHTNTHVSKVIDTASGKYCTKISGKFDKKVLVCVNV